jgi:hypothetical protein
MAERGLTAPVQPGPWQLAGETLGLSLPIVAAAKAPQIARGLLQGGENMRAPATLNPQTGAIVYHGSPHKFDKFDSGKIGTGEGAQAYGHGLYLADAPGVAGGYAETLANKNVVPSQLVSISGKPLNELMAEAPTMARAKVTTYITKANGDMKAAKDALDAFVSEWSGKATPKGKADLLEAQSWMNRLANESPTFIPKPTGYLYKVDLPDSQISRMLDWDKPLSQQAPEVQKALTKHDPSLFRPAFYDQSGALRANADAIPNDPATLEAVAKTGVTLRRRADQLTGADLYRSMNPQEFAGAQVDMAERLRRAGIPGIRYLDGGSRGAGSGTSNYVVFPGNENLLQILERNGQPMNSLSSLVKK